jgi:hypothetical protein
MNDVILLPTYANLTGKNDRAVRSLCCNARCQVAYRSMNTTVGEQLVYACNRCTKSTSCVSVTKLREEP